jgi:dienelactone hydrolase
MSVWTNYAAAGPVVAGEGFMTMMPKFFRPDGTFPVAVYCHGHGEDAWLPMQPGRPGQYQFLRAVAEAGSLVLSGDFGGNLWGNDTVHAQIGATIAYAQGRLGGKSGEVAILGTSMGGCTALSYGARYPAKVACIVAIGPACNLAVLDPNFGTIDAAYGGTYSDAIHGPDHNPQKMATLGKFNSMPVRIWYGNTDVVVAPSLITALKAAIDANSANPQCSITPVSGGHAEATWFNVPPSQMVEYLRTYLPTS